MFSTSKFLGSTGIVSIPVVFYLSGLRVLKTVLRIQDDPTMKLTWQVALASAAAAIGTYALVQHLMTASTTSTTTTTSTSSSVSNSKKTTTKTKKAKQKKKKKGFKAGFLNGLNGLDSPSKPAGRKSSSSSSSSSRPPPRKLTSAELEAEAIADFIQTSQNMQTVVGSDAPETEKQSALRLLQRRRQGIVAGLQNINGDSSIAKLEQALTTMTPPPPPPEPKELYNQAIAHRIMIDPKFKMEKKEATGLEKEIQSTVRQAYWDSVRYKLSMNEPKKTSKIMISFIREV